MRLVYLFILVISVSRVFGQEKLSIEVYFERDRSELTSQGRTELEAWLNQLPDSLKKITITGHTDFLGSVEHNLILSENRAETVMNFIEQSQATRYKMSLVSYLGEEQSKDNGSELGVPKDRKVEIEAILYNKPKPAIEKKEEIVEPVEKPKQVSLATELLEKAEVGQSIVFGNLNFFPGRHFLVPTALPELEQLIESLKQNPNIEIEIIGHICCKLDSLDGLDVNTRTYTLSANRAQYIHDQLVLAGIDESRLSHRGMAGSRPLVVPELTDRDRARNRRVEIRVTAK